LEQRDRFDHIYTNFYCRASGARAALANCLKRLCNELNESGEPDLIESVPALGYRLK